jgi:hypothetical protein
MTAIAAFLADWQLARYLARRCTKRTERWLIRRRSDGTLWAGGTAQNFAYAMRGLFIKRRLTFHFWRVREWRGLHIASRRVFWIPAGEAEFDLIASNATQFVLPPWPEAVECAKIDARPFG